MSEFLQTLSQMWDTIVANATNSGSGSWLILASMIAIWMIFCVLIIRDHIKNPGKYKDSDRFIPPF